MKVFDKIAEITTWVDQQRQADRTIGFVPTMGALHKGHISLVKCSIIQNHLTVVSIFVNPIQFNNPEDLKNYPRHLDEDINMLWDAGVDAVFTPSAEEMYPEPVNKSYDFGRLALVMEGEFRPGHFNGVAVVVHKLFEIVKPTRAYFGEKDYQQLQIIKTLVDKYNIPVKIVACPISRDVDGLALSSRNSRLSAEMRDAAPFIYSKLLEAKKMAIDHTAGELISYINDSFLNQNQLKLEYFVIADGDNLEAVTGRILPNSYGFIAVFAGNVRLIDNIRLI